MRYIANRNDIREGWKEFYRVPEKLSEFLGDNKWKQSGKIKNE